MAARRRRPGRPEKVTPEQVAKALQEARGIALGAARILGVHRNTITNYMDRHPELRQHHREAVEATTDVAESHVIAGVDAGDPQYVKFWLLTRGRSRGYSYKHDVAPVTVEHRTAPQLDVEDPARIQGVLDVLADAGVVPRTLHSEANRTRH